MQFRDTRILSQPVRVHWNGWETDTLRLQRTGWDLAVDYDSRYERYRLAARHRDANLWGLAEPLHIPREWAFPGSGVDFRGPTYEQGKWMTATEMRYHEEERHRFVFNFTHFANKIQIHNMYDEPGPMQFRQIDAEPCIQHNFEPKDLADFCVFRFAPPGEEVFVEEADMDVIDHLEAIKKLQSKEQLEIRERMLREKQAEPETEIVTHANIVTLRRAS